MKKFLIMVFTLTLAAVVSSAQINQTPNYKFSLPPVGYQNWGTLINNNFSALDTFLAQAQNPYQGTWNNSTIYSKGMTITYNGGYYISNVSSNVNNIPSSTAQWTLIVFPPILTSGGMQVATSSTTTRLATYNDIVSLFSSCSGTQYLGFDGNCHTPSSVSFGSGIVFGTGSGSTNRIATVSDITSLFGSFSGTQYADSTGHFSTPAGSVPSVANNNGVKGTGTGITDAGSPGVFQNQIPSLSSISIRGSGTAGIPWNQININILGNSTVSNVVSSLINGVCDETAPGRSFAGGTCRTMTAYSCDSSDNCTVQIPNQDGFFVVNGWYSAGGNSPGCMGDGPYKVTAATATSITFNATTSNASCTSTSGAGANFFTDLVNKFGCSGCVWSTITSGSNNWNYNNWLAVGQAQLAAGHTPVMAIRTGHINDSRQFLSSGTTSGIISDLTTAFSAVQSAMPGAPMVLIEENSMQQGHGVGSAFMCPPGTAHTASCTVNSTIAPTVTSGAISSVSGITAAITNCTITAGTFGTAVAQASCTASANSIPVGGTFVINGFSTFTYLNTFYGKYAQNGQTFTALSGTNSTTLVFNLNEYHGTVSSTADVGTAQQINLITLNTVDNSLWPGPGAPMTVILPGNTGQYATILDTTGSGVQETAPIYTMSVTGSAMTIGVLNVNAHVAGFQAVTAEATAAQVASSAIHYAYLGMLAKFKTLIGVPTQSSLYGTLAPVYQTVGCFADQLHPINCIEEEMHQVMRVVAPAVNTASYDTKQRNEWVETVFPGPSSSGIGNYQWKYAPPSLDRLFSPNQAAVARVSNLANDYQIWNPASGNGYALGCEDSLYYTSVMSGVTIPSSNNATHIYIAFPQNSSIPASVSFIPGLDVVNWVGHGCFLPTSISGAANGNLQEVLTVSNNPWNGYMLSNAGNIVSIQRPIMVDPGYSGPYAASPNYTHLGYMQISAANFNSGVSGSFTYTLFADTPSQLLAPEASIGFGDIVCSQGLGCFKLSATTTLCARVSATSTSSICSDTQGTVNYTSFYAGSGTTWADVYVARAPDKKVGNLIIDEAADPNLSNTVPVGSQKACFKTKSVTGASNELDYICMQATPQAGNNSEVDVTWNNIIGGSGPHPKGTVGQGLWVPNGTPTYVAGTNVTSVSCAASYTCTNERGELTIVGGTATTGIIATLNFSTTLGGTPFCSVWQEGGTTSFGISHGVPSTSSFTISSANTVVSATVTVDYICRP